MFSLVLLVVGIYVVKNHYREVLLTSGAFLLINGGYFIVVIFTLSHGGVTLKMGIQTMLNAVMVASAVQIVACIAFGALSDRIGRVPVVMAGAVFIGFYIFPLFWLVQTRDPAVITLGITIALIAFGAVYGPVAAYFTEIFHASMRYSGASLGIKLAPCLAAGWRRSLLPRSSPPSMAQSGRFAST